MSEWIKKACRLPDSGRVLVYSPEYEHDPTMEYRIMDSQFARVSVDVSHWKPLTPPEDA